MAKELLPEIAVAGDFTSEAFNIDDAGVYTRVDYRRLNGTLYMRSVLSHNLGHGQYGKVTLTYYDHTGTNPLYDVVWNIEYDINRKIVVKKVER